MISIDTMHMPDKNEQSTLTKPEYSEDRYTKLCQDIANGDQNAFDQLYAELVEILYKYGYHITKNQPLVEDAIHDLFIELWLNRESLNEKINVKAYLMVALRRKLIRQVSKQRKLFPEELHDGDIMSLFSDTLKDLSQGETQSVEELEEKIRSLVNKLTNQQREVIFLRFYQNMSYAEIALTMDIDQRHAYNLASKAFSFLKSRLKLTSFTLLVFLLSL